MLGHNYRLVTKLLAAVAALATLGFRSPPFSEYSVGVWPNYYWAGHPQPSFDTRTSRAASRAARLDHSMLWIIPWRGK